MNRRLLLGLLSIAPIAGAGGCFQELDTGVASAGPVQGSTVPPDAAGSGSVTQCAPNSAECFALCGSPMCYTPVSGGSIPVAESTPPIYNPDGSTTSNPCDQIEAESLVIRARSCGQCHTKASNQGGFSYVLDDALLVTTPSGRDKAPNDPWQMLIPNDPVDSYVYHRIVVGEMPPSSDTAAGLIGSDQAQTIVYPSAADESVLYTWISNCVQGADGGAYSISEYGAGGPYGPDAGGGAPASGNGAASASAPATDAGGDGGAPTSGNSPPATGGGVDSGAQTGNPGRATDAGADSGAPGNGNGTGRARDAGPG
jgi:hypothetical protein